LSKIQTNNDGIRVGSIINSMPLFDLLIFFLVSNNLVKPLTHFKRLPNFTLATKSRHDPKFQVPNHPTLLENIHRK